MKNSPGTLTCVGTGMSLAGQISVYAHSCIENADVVFALMPDAISENWLKTLNDDVRSLQQFYAVGKSRRDSYAQMVEAMVLEVRAGRKVVGAFYGHPGVFAQVPHEAIRTAQAEGFRATMEPGISAEACLYADVGFDPGSSGCQSFEASQFMFYNHVVDPTAYLILWQIGIAGEHTLTRFETNPEWLRILVEHLHQWYPDDHEILLYEAATLPIQTPRIEWLKLADLPTAETSQKTTLLLPPAQKMLPNCDMLRRLGIKESDL